MKQIPEFPNYSVTEDGEVFNTHRNKWIKRYQRSDGYFTIVLYGGILKRKQNFLIHRLIASAYIPNPDNKPYINHKNGIKSDIRLSNLEWVTGQENRIHAVSTGLITNTTKGRRMHSKLDEYQVRTIRKCLEDGMMCKDLAPYFKVSQTLISAIKRRVAWLES